jgi:hypothetical protein
MPNLPVRPPVPQRHEPIAVNFTPIPRPDFALSPDKDFIDRDLGDWKIQVATSLANAVPANVDRTTITIHKHQIIVERQDNLYKVVSMVENILIIASSALLIGVSGAAVAFALSTIASISG